jgi:hypothetical protein
MNGGKTIYRLHVKDMPVNDCAGQRRVVFGGLDEARIRLSGHSSPPSSPSRDRSGRWRPSICRGAPTLYIQA